MRVCLCLMLVDALTMVVVVVVCVRACGCACVRAHTSVQNMLLDEHSIVQTHRHTLSQ